MKFYLAGPVVTNDPVVKEQMRNIEETLDNMQLPDLCPGTCDMRPDYPQVYRPGKHHVPNAWGIDMQTWGQCVFTMDVLAIDECDWLVLADYGRQATAGTAWEAGYAFAKGVKILVIKMPGVEESSLMTQGCAANICTYEDFIFGIDCNPKNFQVWDEIYGKKYENFFYERGRLPHTKVLN